MNAKSPVGIWNIKHRDWRGFMELHADGKFRRMSHPDSGSWERDADGTILLKWDRWKPERARLVDGKMIGDRFEGERASWIWARPGAPSDVPCRIVSFHMDNVRKDALEAQRKVFEKFGLTVEQVRFADSHWRAIDRHLASWKDEVLLIFDVDAFPVHQDAIPGVLSVLSEKPCLLGGIQSSNHIAPGHLYAGPFCMGLTRTVFEALGKPSFAPTKRSDVGSELTWLATEKGIPVKFMRPTSVEEPLWKLPFGERFGRGTGYGFEDGAEMVWHAFKHDSARVIRKANEVLAS